MSITAISPNAYWLTSQPRNAAKQAVSTETATTQDTAKSTSSSVTVLSARNDTAGQNIPTQTSSATNAALLAAQEVETTAPASAEPTPWEAAGYTSRREWLLSGEYVPEGMEGRENYVVYVALDEVPEEDRLIREKQMQEEFDNPLVRYENHIASVESNVEIRQQRLANAKAELDKYLSEGSKYPDSIKNIHERIANAEAGLEEAQKQLETAKARYAEAAERVATRESGPVFNISYKLTDMATPINPGEEGYPDIVLAGKLTDSVAAFEAKIEKLQAEHEEQRRADMLQKAEILLKASQQNAAIIQQLDPDSPSNISATISIGNKLLAHIDANGFLVPQGSGQYLYSLNSKADALGLKGQQRADFIKAEIEQQYSHLKVTEYTAETRPTKREFAQQWFPDMARDMDADYQQRLTEAYANLQKAEELYFEQLNA